MKLKRTWIVCNCQKMTRNSCQPICSIQLETHNFYHKTFSYYLLSVTHNPRSKKSVRHIKTFLYFLWNDMHFSHNVYLHHSTLESEKCQAFSNATQMELFILCKFYWNECPKVVSFLKWSRSETDSLMHHQSWLVSKVSQRSKVFMRKGRK